MTPRLFTLDDRLMACVHMLSGGVLADIGTDHAYLPIWAILQGIVPSAIAADVNEGPLKAAQKNVQRYGISEKISLRLSDGLEKIEADEVDDIVIAGMGGELISRIISQADWLKNDRKILILQPMTKDEVLRKYVKESGFTVTQEEAVMASGKVYTVMKAVYTEVSENQSPLFPYIGLLTGKTEAEKAYIEKKLRMLQNKVNGGETDKQQIIDAIKGELL